MAWIDLTRVVDEALEPYGEGAYRDPAVSIRSWCSIGEQGFAVQRLRLGTQTGTHVDAPAHFVEGGATVEHLPADDLVGPFRLFITQPSGDVHEVRDDEGAVPASSRLFLRAHNPLNRAAFAALLDLGARVWILEGSLTVMDDGGDPLWAHREVARGGVFLVEELDEHAAAAITRPGSVVVAPLRLRGTSGAPARVLARREEAR